MPPCIIIISTGISMQIHTHVQFFCLLDMWHTFYRNANKRKIYYIHNYDKVKKFENKNEKRFLGNKVTETLLQVWEFLFYTHIHSSMVNIWQNLSLLPVARSRASNIESDNSQNFGLEDYKNISDGIFPHFTAPSIKIRLGWKEFEDSLKP